MAGMAVDGLVSGMNTTEMIGQLMQLEAAPQTLLKGKVTKAESLVSAMQSLNTKLSSLKDAATRAATATSWQAVAATSSAASVTASAAGTAQPSSLSFSVDRLAARQTSLSGAVTDLAGFFDGATPAQLTVATGKDAASSTYTTIDLTGVTDLAGLVGAINTSDAGVTATLVNLNGSARVQLSGTNTGADAAFDLYEGAVTADDAATNPVLMGRTTRTDGADTPGSAVVTTAQDALVTLWKGTDAAAPVTSSTNTFKDIVAGVSFTVSALETDPLKPVTVVVGRDEAALKKLGSVLVTNIATVLAEITSRTKPTTTTSSDGRQVVSGGILSADSATRQAQQSVLSAASTPVAGASPATIGLVLGKDGTVTFDETKFSAALAADPANVQKVLTAIATRVETVAKGLSDPTTGSLTLKIQGQQSYVKNLSEQVGSWDSRLALRRTTLERTYASLEVSLSKINSQANWLSSQLESLSASSK